MKAIQLVRHGEVSQSCECVTLDEPSEPSAGEVTVRIEAAAINPADLLIFENRYPGPESLPAFVGIEGAGVVTAVGPDVSELAVGDHVISLGRANWAQTVTAEANQFVPIPAELDWKDAAQLKANPPSAHLMLSDYVTLKRGDWVIQNAANSAVGRHVIAFCKARGYRSINVVRRESLIDEISALGADEVVVDTDDLGNQVRQRIGADAPLPLGIDAIGGTGTLKLADCLSDGGTVVNYGFLSGEPCQMTPTHTIVKGLTLQGFWLVGFMRKSSRDAIIGMYQEMSHAFMNGTLNVPVEAEYSLDDISQALAHANRESRVGKILLRPNG